MDDLEWTEHINEITSKATKTLDLLCRNLVFASNETKAATYKIRVRPKLEYAMSVRMPYNQLDINRDRKKYRGLLSIGQKSAGAIRVTLKKCLENTQCPDLQERFRCLYSTKSITKKNRHLSEADGGSRRTRSDHSFQYRRPKPYTDGFKNSFFPRTVATWNGLILQPKLFHRYSLRKNDYSTILKILPSKIENFQIKKF